MRPILLAAITFAFGLAPAAFARADEPRSIVEQAIRAYGGEQKLGQLKAVRTKAKGTLKLGAGLPFTWDVTWQSPNLYRLDAELGPEGNKVSFVQTFDGARAWGHANGVTAAVEGKKLDDLKSQMHLRRVLMLTSLLSDKKYKLASLDEIMVNGKPAVGIRVAAEGERDVKLYFDKATGLISKIEREVYDDASKRDVPQEEFPSDYQDVSGLQTAMREVWRRAGMDVVEMTYSEVT